MMLINKGLEKLLKVFMTVSTFMVLSISFIQVVSRFIFQLPIPWSTDITRMGFIYAVFSGAAYCAKNNDNINLDVVLSAVPQKIRQVMELIIQVVVLGFAAILTFYGLKYTLAGAEQQAPYLPMPMSVFFVALPICTTIIVFYYAQHIVERVKNLKNPSKEV